MVGLVTIAKTFPNSSTTVTPEKSVAQIEAYLVKMGATRILKDYGELGPDSVVMAVSFQVRAKPTDPYASYTLPANYLLTLDAMKRWGNVPFKYLTQHQAHRVSWRNMTDWVRSQAVFIFTGGGSAAEVFLPYLDVGGDSLYRRVLALPHGVAGISNKLGYGGPA